jgi:hypothetical protein
MPPPGSQGHGTRHGDVSKLLRAFQGDLSGQKTEREQIRASIAS